MTEHRKMRVISIEHDIPHHEVTIKCEMNRIDFSMMSGEQIYILTECDLMERDLEYNKLFKRYQEVRDELLRYKRLMKDLKLMMEVEK